MPLMPAFHRRKKDSAVVGRLIAGHGELEFLLAMCTGVALAARRKPDPKHTRPRHRIRYEHIGIKRFFKIRGDRLRNCGRLNTSIRFSHSDHLIDSILGHSTKDRGTKLRVAEPRCRGRFKTDAAYLTSANSESHSRSG